MRLLDTIIIPGSLKIYDTIKNEDTYATYGELSSDLRDGLLDSARIIQKNNSKLQRQKLNRMVDRYTIMNKAVSFLLQDLQRKL